MLTYLHAVRLPRWQAGEAATIEASFEFGRLPFSLTFYSGKSLFVTTNCCGESRCIFRSLGTPVFRLFFGSLVN